MQISPTYYKCAKMRAESVRELCRISTLLFSSCPAWCSSVLAGATLESREVGVVEMEMAEVLVSPGAPKWL